MVCLFDERKRLGMTGGELGKAVGVTQQYISWLETGRRRAAGDTMVKLAGATGGLPSSWAQSTAQQVYDRHMSELEDKIPELRRLAYEMHQDEGNDILSRIKLLQDMDDRDYSRQRDAIGDQRYADELAYQRGRDAIGDRRYEDERDYSRQRDAIGDQRYADELAYQRGRDTIGDQRYEDERDYSRRQDALNWQYKVQQAAKSQTSGREVEDEDVLARMLAAGSDSQARQYLASMGYKDSDRDWFWNTYMDAKYSKDKWSGTTGKSENLLTVPGYGEISYEDAERLEDGGYIKLMGLDENGNPVYARTGKKAGQNIKMTR